MTTVTYAEADRDTAQSLGVPPIRLLARILQGDQINKLLTTVVLLGVPDVLAREAQSADALATAVGAHGPTLHRMLRYLTSVGLFEEGADGRFGLNPLSELLRSDVEGSVAPGVLLRNETNITTGDVLHTAVTGQPAFDHAHKASYYEYVAGRPELETLWNATMSNRTSRLSSSLGEHIDWTGVSNVVDVGGNEGALLAGILAAHPEVTGVLFDQPHVVPASTDVFRGAGVAERASALGGDFFLSVPSGADLYFLANVLWNWPDEQALTILGNCRAAMTPSARLVICEFVVPDAPGVHPAKAFDIANMLLFGGKARTAREWEALLAAADLTVACVTDATLDWTIIEARPIETAA